MSALALFVTFLALLLCAAAAVSAQGYSLVGNQFFLQKASAPMPGSAPAATPAPQAVASFLPDTLPGPGRGAVSLNPGAASLFRGRSGGGLFAPVLKAPPSVKRLLDLIASAEAGKAQYDAVQYGATRKPPKKPTNMTIAEINAWIDATPGQPHAIGRYQMIPATLRRLVRHQGVKPQARFSPELQDQLAHQLIEEAGYSAFLQSEMPRKTFMLNLAKIWAGLPVSSGKSYYEGYAGNSASLTWAHFNTEMQRIFPS
ncbi:hypothetical protein K3722_15445 [Leisingera caerulea]|uniref:Transglycosylase SLT domain-containing protein n=1 Tax=Leisingera caerulea TaxID=506591 RepID=A0ABY5WUD7_LEICA|nr:hypothetical protein [Leisingera caerulea]UWQ57870.1 hypothetical protein K3722_15445 [Leisingera caerulea]